MASAISNAVVRLFAEYLGRGPTRARTTFGRDLVTVILEETLTKGERVLVRNGDVQTVLDTRRTYQRAMREELVAAVEAHTNRRVNAFMSDHHVDPDIAAEIFVLEPLPDLNAPAT